MTYEHLQELSLEYFGGKRTGDLMSRLGNDTDRICNFLSMNLLDFGTDVIMIVMTAGMLVAMDLESGSGNAGAVPDHRLARHRFAAAAPPQPPAREPRLVGDDQRPGRHDPGHPRRQGVRPGAPRGRAVPHQQRPRPTRQRPGQHDLVVLRPDGQPPDSVRAA